MTIDPEAIANEVLAAESKSFDAIRVLLDTKLGLPGQIPVFRSKMGDTESYIASVSFSWMKTNVGFAHSLPLFDTKVDSETKKISIDHETIDLLMQRKLDWSRQAPMAQYLLARQNHKFPPILAALSDSWVDDPDADQWSNGIALSNTGKFVPLDSAGKFGLLYIAPSAQLFALDGQHRLLAIEGALELAEQGTLPIYDKDRKKQNGILTREELMDQYSSLTLTDLQGLRNESIGIEILPAVTVGETRDEARRRIRTVFVHVNRLAAPLGKSQMSALDEDNGFRILARAIATEHTLFKTIQGAGDEKLERVDFEKSNLTPKSEELTTLETIANCARAYLQTPVYTQWEPQLKGLVPLRPDEGELEAGLAELTDYFNLFMELPSILRVRQGISTQFLREFNVPGGQHNLLMRPEGQIVLAYAVGHAHYEKAMPLESVFSKLSTFDSSGGFDKIDSKSSFWWGILTTTEAQPRMRNAGRATAMNLMQYLLGAYDQAGLDSLTEKVSNARRNSEGQVVGFDGTVLLPGQSLSLPPLLAS
jgi:hypothetical protein